MAVTQADLDNLQAIRFSGAARVTVGDKTIEYRTEAELRAIIASVESELSASPTLRVMRLASTKGISA